MLDETWAIKPFHVLIDLVSLPRGIRKRDLKDPTGCLGFESTGRFPLLLSSEPERSGGVSSTTGSSLDGIVTMCRCSMNWRSPARVSRKLCSNRPDAG